MGFARERFLAEPLAVREALLRIEARALVGLAQDEREIALLVLAEVLNNVAEHAYRGGAGPVTVCLWQSGGVLRVQVLDRGAKAPPFDVVALPDPADLPDGGFGLGLIRTLARKVDRRHRFGCNVQRFRFFGDNVWTNSDFVSDS